MNSEETETFFNKNVHTFLQNLNVNGNKIDINRIPPDIAKIIVNKYILPMFLKDTKDRHISDQLKVDIC